MLKVRGSISGFFQLVLGVLSKLTSDTVNKSLEAPEIFPEEGIEFWPRDGSDAFVTLLVLSLSKADGATEEDGGKRDMIHPYGAWGLKIIFILLTKVVAIHVRFSGIGFRGPSLKWALPWL